jgi:hypothetical protein
MRTPTVLLLAALSLTLPSCLVSRAPFDFPSGDASRSSDTADGDTPRDAAQRLTEGLVARDAADGASGELGASDRPAGRDAGPLDEGALALDGGRASDVQTEGDAPDVSELPDAAAPPGDGPRADLPAHCGPLEGLCGGTCVALLLDPAHCGACGRRCPAGEHATASCNGGRCELACAHGYADCGRGCQDVQGDGANCGACGRTCPFAPHALPLCVEGRCGLDCGTTGYTDCDGDPANGCEAGLRSDPLNCGGCGRRCGEGQTCSGSVCRG